MHGIHVTAHCLFPFWHLLSFLSSFISHHLSPLLCLPDSQSSSSWRTGSGPACPTFANLHLFSPHLTFLKNCYYSSLHSLTWRSVCLSLSPPFLATLKTPTVEVNEKIEQITSLLKRARYSVDTRPRLVLTCSII